MHNSSHEQAISLAAPEQVAEAISRPIGPSSGGLATTVASPQDIQKDFQNIFSADATEALAEYEALDADINDRTALWKPRFQSVMDEFEDEILPLLDRMNSLLSYHGSMHTPGLPGWGKWYEKYRHSVGLKMTMRTVQRKLAQLRDGAEPEVENDEASGNSTEEEEHEIEASPLVVESPRELLSKRLKELHATLSGKSVKNDAMRLERALELVENTQLAIAEGLLEFEHSTEDERPGSPDGQTTEIVRQSITPGLSRMSVPTVSAQDGNEALWQAATAAATTAANAVGEDDIKPRFQPALMFYTNRQTVKFGRMLKKHGIEPYTLRGKTSYDFPDPPIYCTYEEAWAYVSSFAAALPGLNIGYGVRIKDMHGFHGQPPTIHGG